MGNIQFTKKKKEKSEINKLNKFRSSKSPRPGFAISHKYLKICIEFIFTIRDSLCLYYTLYIP